MDAKDLKDTTMNPLTRTLIRVTIVEEDPGETGDLVERLMGKKPELRFQYIQEITFSSTFCTLLPREARIIVSHWEGLKELKCRLLLKNASEESITAAVAVHLEQALAQLASLLLRLETALLTETRLSSVGKAFVKLSTRSPKDSKKILEKAKSAYRGQ